MVDYGWSDCDRVDTIQEFCTNYVNDEPSLGLTNMIDYGNMMVCYVKLYRFKIYL